MKIDKFDDYQELTGRTWNGSVAWREQLANAALGLGEAGELQGELKKFLFHGHELNADAIEKEIGDILYYAARLSVLIGTDLSTVAGRNIEKLRKRFPLGFSSEASMARVDVVSEQ